jgi:3-phytase
VRGDLIAVLDRKDGRLRLSRYDFASGAAASLDARPLTLGYAGEGLCLHKSARDGALYAFTLGRARGSWISGCCSTADGKLDGRIVRRLHLSSEAKYCVADDASGRSMSPSRRSGSGATTPIPKPRPWRPWSTSTAWATSRARSAAWPS